MIAVPFELWVAIGTSLVVLFFAYMWYKDVKKGKERPIAGDLRHEDVIRCNICGAVFKKNKDKRCPVCGSYN